MHQRAGRCHLLALLVHPGSHRHKTRMPGSTSLWFCQQIYQTCRSLSEHEDPTVQKRAFVLTSFVYVTTEMFLFSLPFPVRKTVETGKCGYIWTRHPCLENWPQVLLHAEHSQHALWTTCLPRWALLWSRYPRESPSGKYSGLQWCPSYTLTFPWSSLFSSVSWVMFSCTCRTPIEHPFIVLVQSRAQRVFGWQVCMPQQDLKQQAEEIYGDLRNTNQGQCWYSWLTSHSQPRRGRHVAHTACCECSPWSWTCGQFSRHGCLVHMYTHLYSQL